MQYSVFFLQALFTNIFRNARFVSKFTHCIDIISICPELATPKLTFHFRMFFEYLLRSNTLHYGDDCGGTHLGNRLNQKMNMILICSYFQKMYLIPFLYFKTYFLQRLINFLAKYYSPIFCWTHKVIQQYRYIMRFMYVLTLTHTYKVSIFTPRAAGN